MLHRRDNLGQILIEKQQRSMTTNPVLVATIITLLSSFYSLGFAWNISAHMISGAIAY